MFVVTMIAPDGFPVAMGIYGSMEQAVKSVHISDANGKADFTKESANYAHGTMAIAILGIKANAIITVNFSIARVELSLIAGSMFRR